VPVWVRLTSPTRHTQDDDALKMERCQQWLRFLKKSTTLPFVIFRITHLLVKTVFVARVIKTMVPLSKRFAPYTRVGGAASAAAAVPFPCQRFGGTLAVLRPLGAYSSVGRRRLVAILPATAGASATPRKTSAASLQTPNLEPICSSYVASQSQCPSFARCCPPQVGGRSAHDSPWRPSLTVGRPQTGGPQHSALPQARPPVSPLGIWRYLRQLQFPGCVQRLTASDESPAPTNVHIAAHAAKAASPTFAKVRSPRRHHAACHPLACIDRSSEEGRRVGATS